MIENIENPIFSKLPMPTDLLQVDSKQLSPQQVVGLLTNILTEERIQTIDQVLQSRTNQFVPVLEDIYDRGNINAVMRSAEAFGFYNFYVVDKEGAKHKDSNRITKGTHKWLNIHKFNSCLLYTSPSPRDQRGSRMPSSA